MSGGFVQGKPSDEARHILATEGGGHGGIDRTPENLPLLRAETLAYITPAVKRVLAATGVSTKTTDIAGIDCLIVTPPELRVQWPVLYGYGGGFVQGSPFEDLTIAAPLCAITGAKVIIPHYRLAPEHPWPAAIQDGMAVYRALSGAPFALVGESAGGNFALALMLQAAKDGLNMPGVAALLSPWCDLSNTSDSQGFNDGRDPTLTMQDSQSAAHHYAGANDVSNPAISPINGDFDAGFPPCIITTGTRDLLLSQAVSLSNILRSRDVPVDLQVWEGLWHVFEWDDRLPEAARSLSRIAAFLLQHMARTSA